MKTTLKKKSLVLLLVTYLIFVALQAKAAGPWEGRIIDIETKEPLEGAVVLAVWLRAYRTPAGDNTYFYEAKEVLTDKEGRYEIPSYRPINLLPIVSYIREPEFIVFKPGYLSIDIRLDENVTDKTVDLPEKGKTFRLAPGIIELPRLKTREERTRSLNSVEGFPIDDAPSYKIKKLLELIDIENKNLGFKK